MAHSNRKWLHCALLFALRKQLIQWPPHQRTIFIFDRGSESHCPFSWAAVFPYRRINSFIVEVGIKKRNRTESIVVRFAKSASFTTKISCTIHLAPWVVLYNNVENAFRSEMSKLECARVHLLTRSNSSVWINKRNEMKRHVKSVHRLSAEFSSMTCIVPLALAVSVMCEPIDANRRNQQIDRSI